MKVAILHNPRPPVADPTAPDDCYEEYDGPETIAAIASALGKLGMETTPVVADRRMPWTLDRGRFDFVFNIAEGEGRRCREAIPAAVCELLGLPYTFSDPLTLAATLDKAVARRLVSPEVPVARAELIGGVADETRLDGLAFPVVVKPNDEGSSKGIDSGAFCVDAAEAARRCRWLRERYGCPALVEEYLPGAEITAAVRGNGGDASVLGMMEIAPADPVPAPFLYSVEVKRDWRRRVRYHVPPRQACSLGELALTAYRLLGCRDLARLDFRLDAAGRPRFLECNPLPGLHPHESDIVILSRGLLPYDSLVQGILRDAAARTGCTLAAKMV